jgi:hypothetical protein
LGVAVSVMNVSCLIIAEQDPGQSIEPPSPVPVTRPGPEAETVT